MFLFNNMKSNASKTLGIYVSLNSAFGLWPLRKKNFFVETLWFVSTFEMALLVMICLHELYFTCDYGELSIDILVIISFGLIGLAKLIFYYINRENLRFNIESAIEDWSSEEMMQNDSITRRYKRIYERIIKIYLTLGLSASLMYPLKIYHFDRDSFVNVDDDQQQRSAQTTTVIKKRFLFPSVCSFNDASATLYNLIILNQFFQFVICVGSNLTADSFFITITYHLCGQFEILKRNFASFEKVVDDEKKTKEEFGYLVARHERLLILTKSIEKSLNIIIFTQVVVNLILFNVAGINFLIYVKKKEKCNALTHFGIIAFTLTQTFVYAYIGENISSKIEAITQSIFDGNWQTLPKKMGKDVIFLMILSNTTIYLTAGKLFRMKKSTFTQILKTSISYLSVFNALINDY